MSKYLPSILTIGFIAILFSINVFIKWNNNNMFRNYLCIDEPIRKVLEEDDFLSDEKDAEILVINLWAIWCKPCQKEIPKLNKLLNKYEREDVLFLAITAEKQKDVEEWSDLQKHQFMYFQLFEQQDLLNYLFELNPDPSFKKGQKPQSYPTNIIIKNNELIYYEIGYSDESFKKLENKLKEIL